MTIILENLNGIAAMGIGIGLMTIVGQCIGAGEKEQAVYYVKKLSWISEAVVVGCCLLLFALTKTDYVHRRYGSCQRGHVFLYDGLDHAGETHRMGNGVHPRLRTARSRGREVLHDRLHHFHVGVPGGALRYLCRVQGFGPIAVWIGMFVDWTVRGIIFGIRFKSRKWLRHRVV